MASADADVDPQDVAKEFSNEDNPESTDYKVPKKVDLETIVKTDADDEALIKYKETLLGGFKDVKDDGGANVLLKAMHFKPTGREAISLDLTKTDLQSLKKNPILVKEGCKYIISIDFKVQRDIVSGLRYRQSSYRKGIRVENSTIMMGSYGPKELHCFNTVEDTTPSGMLARGSYNVKSKFIDDDENTVLEWEWTFEIKKEWS
ncbi:Rho GDP-dissociation inhibitor 1-like [Oopsacas minuta]|uniref:Rho GDP-dissociation inhibitor 1-like n=1 Tax=Oopsacas minuta TaxID=111878 RepID=A0AAV7JPM5_9METZ|nr:Rho GDP-dissociation inhibitor 1-like [Oopsacas minuta]